MWFLFYLLNSDVLWQWTSLVDDRAGYSVKHESVRELTNLYCIRDSPKIKE